MKSARVCVCVLVRAERVIYDLIQWQKRKKGKKCRNNNVITAIATIIIIVASNPKTHIFHWNMETENIWRKKNSTFYIQDTKQTFAMHQMHLNGLRDVRVGDIYVY